MDVTSRAAQVAAVAALGEPTRRRLYELVVRRSGPVSRDEAAAETRLPRTTVAFHLDRLVGDGLLDVVYERRTGRSGPGAGRPAKLYRRSSREIAVSLPDRRYELAGRLLADALQEAEATGASPRAVLDRRARELGQELGRTAQPDGAFAVLDRLGFEPHRTSTAIVLGNCPFHGLAKHQTELVCGMNLRLLQGLLDGLATTGLVARLAPSPGHCCVRLEGESAGR
ncbi:helix-turn-helix transcriptional regulator [Amycolatopsis albispora]|uniref:Transcriptional regulator n=1 Tax=Amycolatopsis albispora TaxID=1804986 RepID=A0A344L150_9PSEU|nr:helix-turn-helix domain-containing protein [Amycolatopsis albispora]AXB41774.1 transcriptional regulator [Amycolatopsis albispora]